MIVTKCCKTCGTATNPAYMIDGRCNWCASYDTEKKSDIFLAISLAVILVCGILLVTWAVT